MLKFLSLNLVLKTIESLSKTANTKSVSSRNITARRSSAFIDAEWLRGLSSIHIKMPPRELDTHALKTVR
jgi:hypothetical protein